MTFLPTALITWRADVRPPGQTTDRTQRKDRLTYWHVFIIFLEVFIYCLLAMKSSSSRGSPRRQRGFPPTECGLRLRSRNEIWIFLFFRTLSFGCRPRWPQIFGRSGFRYWSVVMIHPMVYSLSIYFAIIYLHFMKGQKRGKERILLSQNPQKTFWV
jgi:hypothetical protein